jgi:hypothetical protein
LKAGGWDEPSVGGIGFRTAGVIDRIGNQR